MLHSRIREGVIGGVSKYAVVAVGEDASDLAEDLRICTGMRIRSMMGWRFATLAEAASSSELTGVCKRATSAAALRARDGRARRVRVDLSEVVVVGTTRLPEDLVSTKVEVTGTQMMQPVLGQVRRMLAEEMTAEDSSSLPSS